LKPSPLPTEDHFQRLIRLLELEAEAEKQQRLQEMQRFSAAEAEASGSTLTNLVIRDEAAGLGGRILLTLGKRNQTQGLPWTRLNGGSPVILSEENPGDPSSSGWRGVVSRVYKDSLQVAFAQWPETESDRPTFRLDRSSDEISRQRQRQALEQARTARDTGSGARLAHLRDVLLGKIAPVFQNRTNFEALDKSLNDSQIEAVSFALSAADVAIIHGPPGTGKTTTVVELIRQIVHSGQRVLAVAPSNIAVDNLVEKLVHTGENVIRLGHPARVLPELRQHTLDALVEKHPEMKVVQRLTREARSLREQAGRFTRSRPEPGARQALRQEAKQALADARKIEDMLVKRLLNAAQVICATNTGLDREMLEGQTFDWCIMDEASQSTEAAAWSPLQLAERLVLAGDHLQLAPTVISAEASAQGFTVSLMERLIKELGKGVSRRLTVQYRMHKQIMDFPSQEFYESSLSAHESVADHLLQGLPLLLANEMTSSAIHFIDTAGASCDESVEAQGESRFNLAEVLLVVKRVQALLNAGLNESKIAVISPYSAQVRLLREHLSAYTEMEIDSVDGFQGREKEAVIVTLVRSNPENQIGFLEDVRRMNVALTRPRRKLIVIGDSATISVHPFYQRMLAYFESINAYHSVWEEGANL
jgi:superfamily I DNA and/or RNA helicase